MSLGLNPHLLDDLPTFTQQATHMKLRNHKPRHNPPSSASHSAVILLVFRPKLRLALENPVVDAEQSLLSGGERRHPPVGIAAAVVGNLDDALGVSGEKLVDVDPGSGVLADGLDDGS